MTFRKRTPKHCLIVDDPRFQPQFKPRKKSSIKWILTVVILGLIGLAVTQLARAQDTQEKPSDFSSLNEAESGQILFPLTNGGFQQAVHLRTKVDAEINGIVASVTYKQKFKNDSDDWREAVYVFPLAENAAVNRMEMRIGNRLIRSVIKEKNEAKKIYEQAKIEGKKAALTEQQRPNLFTQKIANIAPGEEIEITLGYLQQVRYESGKFSFYLPTTLTPRFMPGLPQVPLTELETEKQLTSSPFGWATPTDQVPDAHKISPFMLAGSIDDIRNPIEINIDIRAGLELDNISSRNHQINQSRQDSQSHQYQISLRNGRESMNRDFWLEWNPITSKQPEAAVFKDRINTKESIKGSSHENYALLMLLPPQIGTTGENDLPREVIYIIDTSGSMGGASIQQAKASLQLALKRLDSTDRFNLIEFNSSHTTLFSRPVFATEQNLQRASYFVNRLDAGGGTNMASALEEALLTSAAEGFLKQVIFITDGAVGNEDQLFKLIKTQLGNARLFTVGIGSAPNSHFMTRAAQFGRGTFEYISNQNEIAERMSSLFRKLESPILSNLQITLPKSLEGSIEQFPKRVRDLYAGEPMVLSIKALNGKPLDGNIIISGTVAKAGKKAHWSRSLSLDSKEQHTGISTLWAREKIAALMDEKVLGRDEQEVKEEVLSVAIPHKLISAYTSLVAVEEQISRDNPTPLKLGIVPNTVPHGQNQQPLSYPKTATWLPLNLLLGNLSLLALLGLYRRKIIRVIQIVKATCLKH